MTRDLDGAAHRFLWAVAREIRAAADFAEPASQASSISLIAEGLDVHAHAMTLHRPSWLCSDEISEAAFPELTIQTPSQLCLGGFAKTMLQLIHYTDPIIMLGHVYPYSLCFIM